MSNKKLSSNIKFDKDYLWHPYTSMVDPLPCYEVSHAKGVYIHLSDGAKLIDGMSSWWAAIHGYNHPRLNNAITTQLSKMSHVMFGGLTHSAATDLGRKLHKLTNNHLPHIFLSDSGSISVEVAIKMSLQYWHSLGESGRTTIITPMGGYHGDTWHCMSVCDPEGGMHKIWKGRLPEQVFIPRPKTTFHEKWSTENENTLKDIQNLKLAFKKYHQNLAAFIIEPIVQGAGGMYFYHPQYLKLLRELCNEYDILLIFDEIATGFGRTGKMFAQEWANVKPDIMCVGKALTGGYMTLAATLTTPSVALNIKDAFMHGPTFMGNPLACSVAVASLDILIDNNVLQRVKQIETILNYELSEAKHLPAVMQVRVLGAIGVIEMREPVNLADLQAQFVKNGVWVRPFGRLIYVMPPYIITDEQLITLCRTILTVLSETYLETV